jgi:alpha-mannosidase
MTRREFVNSVLVGSVALAAGAEAADITLYFVDGYHGGLRGHMPPGAWRDIISRLDLTPEWKLCLDIEAVSWHALAEQDPESYARMTKFLREPRASARVEMVGGTFSQPYGWAISGESNIRQLVRGLEVIRRSFPGLPVDTYAMQEPCWASCLPQILKSLGFKFAVLKNPSTAWGGYSAGVDAEIINWIGPDGSSIPTVPRYACEELIDTWHTEAAIGSEAFAQKCLAHGIQHPAGMCFQDLGWVARPNVKGDYIHFVTWREYFDSVAPPTDRTWRFSMEDIRCALPWGEKTIQKLARQVRAAENKIIVAEKTAAMVTAFKGLNYPAEQLQEAWDKILWSQHHDAWITATTRAGRNAWAFQVAAETWDAEAICDTVIQTSLDNLVNQQAATDAATLHIFNSLAHDRSEVVEVELATDRGAQGLQVFDSTGKITASQFETTRKYVTDKTDRVRGDGRNSELMPGESIGAGRLLFRCAVTATGQSSYRIQALSTPNREVQPAAVTARTSVDGSVTIESDLYKIVIDAKRGGIISSLYAKDVLREFCGTGERSFHEFRGYFIEENAWRSSTENAAVLQVIEQGPVRVTLSVAGQIGSVPYRTMISVTQGQRRIEFHTQFRFEHDTWIGDPWEIPATERMTGRRRSEYDDRFKLLALFPASFQQQAIYKNSAFDVCKSINVDTFFYRWDAIKHNIVQNWVDVVDESREVGLALLTDHTTSYVHGKDHPLSLVLGWGWDGGYWWGKCPLNGVQEVHYAILPHAGSWEKAGLWREAAEWSEPLLCRLGSAMPETSGRFLARIDSPGVHLSSVTVSGRDLLLRFFNSDSHADEHTIQLGVAVDSIQFVELDGKPANGTPILSKNATGPAFRAKIPQFGFKTVRLVNVIS